MFLPFPRLKPISEAVQKENNRYKDHNDVKRRDLSCFFHEIRNYSATVKGNVQLLRGAFPPGADLAPVERMEKAAANIERLICEAMHENAGEEKAFGKVSLACLIHACIEDHFQNAKSRFEINLNVDAPCILGDAQKLEQVFVNLFRNALEAGATRVRAGVSRAGEGARIVIEDDGRGCASADLERLFEPFFTTKKAEGGSGLGLYVVKAIVENHGGTIRAENAEGGGLRLVLDFESIK